MRYNKPRLASLKKCTGCMLCVDGCNSNALTSYIGKDGHLYVSLNRLKCTLCRRCEKLCPVVSKYDFENTEAVSEPFAAWANNDEIRKQGSSGGVFGAIAYTFIKEGGVVVGSVIKGKIIEHILIDNINDLHRIQNSKYQQADLSGIYLSVMEKLKNGVNVLFSGTGCQVAAVLNFVGDKYREQLFTVDVICGGFPSILPLMKLDEHEHIKNIDSFRNKRDGWRPAYEFVIEKKNKELVNLKGRNLVTSAFLSHLTNRYSCLDCQFAYKQRQSDITLADFWGDTDFPNEHYKGLSVAIVHSEKGKKMLGHSDITYHHTTFDKILKKNYRLVYGKFFIGKHPARFFLSLIFRYFSYKSLLKIYGAESVHKMDLLIIPFRLFSIFYNSFWERIKNDFVKSILEEKK